MKIRFVLLFLFVIAVSPLAAEDVRPGDPVIVTEYQGSTVESPYEVVLSLGIVQSAGVSEHDVKIYECICHSRSRSCRFFNYKREWVRDNALTKVKSENRSALSNTLKQKGYTPEEYRNCQLDCILNQVWDK